MQNQNSPKQITSTVFKHVKQWQLDQQRWHFHILSPECQLNTEKQYALVIENTDTQESHTFHSTKPLMDMGKDLIQLLHGKDVIVQNAAALSPPSPIVKTMLKQARLTSKHGKFWHHHLLFPACKYNPHPGEWTLIFEDQESGTVLESVTTDEPKSDLKHIETFFYSQKG
jgi:hypothetical protein